MTWLTVKTTLKKAWVWVRTYWQYPAMFFLALFTFTYKKKEALEVLDITKESYKKQIDELNRAHKEEVDRREKNLKRYNEALRLVEKSYENSSLELTKAKKDRIKKLITNFEDHPKELSDIMRVMFGINYVETMDDDNNDN